MNNFLDRLLKQSAVARNLAIAVASLGILTIAAITTYHYLPDREPAPMTQAEAKEFMGWAGEAEAERAWPAMKGSFPPFKIIGAPQANEDKRVVLWDAAKLVSGDQLPTFRQVIGDCVGAGAKQAIDYLQCSRIALGRGNEEFKPVYEPYHYACGREAPECGDGRIRGPSGSIGSWQAKALKLYGIIPEDTSGLEPYSRSVVSRWATRMPKRNYITIGKTHLVQTASRVDTAAEVRDAICNGYSVTIASNWGGKMRPPIEDGKLVNKKVTTWNHQMCVIGYDGVSSKGPYWYILNSWGPHAHGPPPDDSPPGGFWVRERAITYIVKQGDSFALSDLQGFPAQDWDLDVLRDNVEANGIPEPGEN